MPKIVFIVDQTVLDVHRFIDKDTKESLASFNLTLSGVTQQQDKRPISYQFIHETNGNPIKSPEIAGNTTINGELKFSAQEYVTLEEQGILAASFRSGLLKSIELSYEGAEFPALPTTREITNTTLR